jgi:hypothetical protein
MTVTWAEGRTHPISREAESRSSNVWEVIRASPAKSSPQSSRARSISSARFFPHSYLDNGGQLHNSNAVSHLMRTPFKYLNNTVVMLGVLVAVIGGAGLSYFGTLTLGILFSALMLYGAWVQRRGFDYQRLYGVWHGLCPNCKEPLNIGMKAGRTKTVTCSSCASCVTAKDGVFRTVPWYTQLL